MFAIIHNDHVEITDPPVRVQRLSPRERRQAQYELACDGMIARIRNGVRLSRKHRRFSAALIRNAMRVQHHFKWRRCDA